MISEIDFRYCPKCQGNFLKQQNNLLVCEK